MDGGDSLALVCNECTMYFTVVCGCAVLANDEADPEHQVTAIRHCPFCGAENIAEQGSEDDQWRFY